MTRLEFVKSEFINNKLNLPKKENLQNCLNRLKTFEEKTELIKMAESTNNKKH